MQRRDYLKLTGAVLGTLCVTSITGACSSLRAIGPWEGPTNATRDPRLRALSYAVLAANAHNTQPWLVDLRRPSRLSLYVDPDRLLPETDPLQRQTYVSQGTFLEQLVLGAGLDKRRADVSLFPDGDELTQPVAHVSLYEDESLTPDPLADQIPHRMSNRRAYEGGTIPKADLNAITPPRSGELYAKHYDEPKTKSAIAKLCAKAMAIEVSGRNRNEETAKWFRVSDEEAEQHRDGFGLPQAGVTGFEQWFAETFIIGRDESLVDPEGSFPQKAIEITAEQATSASAFVVLISKDNRRRDQVLAGRAYARLQLEATRRGIATHPMSQLLQEYEDMDELFAELKALLRVPKDHTIQMLVRAGYAEPVVHAPRRDVADLVRKKANKAST